MKKEIKKRRRKSKLEKWLISHVYRTGSIFTYIIFSRKMIYKCLGYFNKKREADDRFFYSVFLVYASLESYRDRFTYRWFAKWLKRKEWKLLPCNIFIQNGKAIIVFGITPLESEFQYGSEKYKNGIAKLRFTEVEERLEGIRRDIGAVRITRAGVVPSVTTNLGILKTNLEQETTAIAVIKALEEVKRLEKIPNTYRLIIIGGEGYVGQMVERMLIESNPNLAVYSVDLKNRHKFTNELSVMLKGKSTIILNITKKGALAEYLPFIWEEAVVVNEVYPEPSWEEVAMAIANGKAIYHIIGSDGWVLFPLGGGYKNKIPCCASFIPRNPDDYKILVWRMEPPSEWVDKNIKMLKAVSDER